MGQAKLRGSQEQRISDAKARIDAIRPKSIVCNQCKAELAEVEDLDSRGLAGIDAIFAAHCPDCKSRTLAIKGKPEAVEAFAAAYTAAMGEVPLLGTQ